jgi:hypothetical protein
MANNQHVNDAIQGHLDDLLDGLLLDAGLLGDAGGQVELG